MGLKVTHGRAMKTCKMHQEFYMLIYSYILTFICLDFACMYVCSLFLFLFYFFFFSLFYNYGESLVPSLLRSLCLEQWTPCGVFVWGSLLGAKKVGRRAPGVFSPCLFSVLSLGLKRFPSKNSGCQSVFLLFILAALLPLVWAGASYLKGEWCRAVYVLTSSFHTATTCCLTRTTVTVLCNILIVEEWLQQHLSSVASSCLSIIINKLTLIICN